MSRTVLVIADNYSNAWLDKALDLQEQNTSIEILPVGVSSEMYIQSHQSILKRVHDWKFVELQQAAEAAQQKVREFLPSFIFELPRQQLSPNTILFDLFETPNANLWWFLEITEKSPFRGELINQLYYLAMIREVISSRDYDEVLLALKDEHICAAVLGSGIIRCPVKRVEPYAIEKILGYSFEKLLQDFVFVRYCLCLIRVFVRYLLHWMVIRLTGIGKVQDGDEKPLVFFSFYPLWWKRPYQMDTVERFFELLPSALRARAPVRWAVWLTLGPFELWRKRDSVRAVFKHHGVIPLQGLLSIKDSIHIFSPRHLERLLRLRFQLGHKVRASFDGFNIAPLVLREIYRSMTTSEFFHDLMIMSAFEALTRRVNTKVVIYRVEFQPFEKAILYGISGRSRGVAFQHSTFGQNYLPYFFPAEEISPASSDRNGNGRMPLPDLILTTGRYALEVLERNGIARELLELCGPIRYSTLLDYLRNRESKASLRKRLKLPGQKKVIMIATSIGLQESIDLLAAAGDALQSLTEKPYVIVKMHPALAIDAEVVRRLGSQTGEQACHILRDDEQLYDHISVCDAVIVAGSTLGIEAIALGVLPIVYESQAVFSAKSMSEFRHAMIVASNETELRDAVLSVLEGSGTANRTSQYWPELIEKMFYRLDVDPNQRFISILKQHGILP